MITNTGKSILGKYLIGQVPGYAAYMALGCGAKPTNTFSDYSTKEYLDFEMFRVPITSRGFVTTDDGVSHVVLTAELPTEERYEITEVGIFSAASNSIAGLYDSKQLFTFADGENWVNTDGSEITVETDTVDFSTLSTASFGTYQITADNAGFEDAARLARYERPRYLNNVILLNGDTSTIKLDGVNIDLSQNSPTDVIKVALTVINGSSSTAPATVDLTVTFSDSNGTSGTTYAQIDKTITNGTSAGQYDLTNNRYVVIDTEIQDMTYGATFAWNQVTKVTIEVVSSTTTGHWIALDGIRLENVATTNPVYGLTGYSVLKTSDLLPVIKQENTSNYVEFRFALDIGAP